MNNNNENNNNNIYRNNIINKDVTEEEFCMVYHAFFTWSLFYIYFEICK